MIRLIQPSHKILFVSPSSLLEEAGRTCYKSEEKIGCKDPEVQTTIGCHNICDECRMHSSYPFIKQMLKTKHLSVLEHSLFTVRLITSRGVTHEIVRHRLAAYSQESTRYVNYKGKPMQFIIPSWWYSLLAPLEGMIIKDCDGHIYMTSENPSSVEIPFNEFLNTIEDDNERLSVADWVEGCLEDQARYQRMIDRGMKPEQARGGLPQDLKTEIVMSANFREFLHVFNLRVLGTTGRPHPDMVHLMRPVLEEAAQKCGVFEQSYDALYGGEENA